MFSGGIATRHRGFFARIRSQECISESIGFDLLNSVLRQQILPRGLVQTRERDLDELYDSEFLSLR